MKLHSICRRSLGVCLLLSFPLVIVADDHQTIASRTSRTQIVGTAREVYERLIEAGQSNPQLSVAEIESLNAWSARIETQELSAIGFWNAVDLMRVVEGALPPNIEEVGQATRNAVRDHAARLNQIETLAKRKLADQTADKNAAAAARYFRLVADSVLQQMDAKRVPAVDSLPVPRPSALTSMPFPVFINARSEIIVDGERVSMNQLAEKLAKVSDEKRFAFVEVKASGESLHNHVVAVMDLATDAGFDVTLSTVE